MAGFGGLIGPKSGTSKALTISVRYRNGWNHERSPRHLQHLPRDY